MSLCPVGDCNSIRETLESILFIIFIGDVDDERERP